MATCTPAFCTVKDPPAPLSQMYCLDTIVWEAPAADDKNNSRCRFLAQPGLDSCTEKRRLDKAKTWPNYPKAPNRCLHAMQPKHHQRLPKAHYYYKAKPRKIAEFASLAPFVSEKEISSQACFDEPLVVVVLADDADLVGDEVCAVEADAEPPDGTGQVTASGWEAGRAIRSARAGGGSATQRLALARLQGLHSPSKTRRILLRPERLSMKTVASQKLANHGDVATGRHGLPRLVLVL